MDSLNSLLIGSMSSNHTLIVKGTLITGWLVARPTVLWRKHEHCQEFGSLIGKRLPWKGIFPTSQKPFPQTTKTLIPNSIHWQKDKLHGVGCLETLGTGTSCLILPFPERIYVITYHIPSSPYYSEGIHTKYRLHTNNSIYNSKKEEEIKTKFLKYWEPPTPVFVGVNTITKTTMKTMRIPQGLPKVKFSSVVDGSRNT